jgi:folate-dependent phosphoribosylglycinamide formyltransferase PurN
MTPSEPTSGPVVLLAGPGDATNIVYHYLMPHFDAVTLVEERPLSRAALARRRARRQGWGAVAGQSLFVALVLPMLRVGARRRIAAIVADAGLDATAVADALHVDSVNAPATLELLRRLDPVVVVVNGTRIISESVLGALSCPVVNIHAGITPGYRGVHGGYWALAEDRPDLVGTTVHIVDAGIDTVLVLARGFFEPSRRDSIATYPYLHLAYGLPLLVEVVTRLLAGETADALHGALPSPPGPSAASRLRWHPTLWGYLWRRSVRGVR